MTISDTRFGEQKKFKALFCFIFRHFFDAIIKQDFMIEEFANPYPYRTSCAPVVSSSEVDQSQELIAFGYQSQRLINLKG